jgi:hypothetical protein
MKCHWWLDVKDWKLTKGPGIFRFMALARKSQLDSWDATRAKTCLNIKVPRIDTFK